MIFFGEQSLRRAVNTYLLHCHRQRNHQGLGNKLIDPGDEFDQTNGEIHCREQLGGMLKYCYRTAALAILRNVDIPVFALRAAMNLQTSCCHLPFNSLWRAPKKLIQMV